MGYINSKEDNGGGSERQRIALRTARRGWGEVRERSQSLFAGSRRQSTAIGAGSTAATNQIGVWRQAWCDSSSQARQWTGPRQGKGQGGHGWLAVPGLVL